MEDIFVARLMSTDVVTVRPGTPVGRAAESLLDHHIGSLVVVDEESHPRGILTNTDFVRVVADSDANTETTVGAYMSTDVVATGAQTPIREAADMMLTNGIHHLPVVDDHEGLIGMLSTTDLTAYLSDVESPSPD